MTASEIKRRKKKSWQRRRKRRIILMTKALLFCIFFIVAVLMLKSFMPYEKVDMANYVVYKFHGYNTKGRVEASIDTELLSSLMMKLKDDYDKAMIKHRKCEPQDYNAFYNSITVSVESPEYLSNGSKFKYTVKYDEELAKKLKLKVKNDSREVMVSGLVTATVISLDELFDGISFTFEGVSPNVTATLNNNTTHPLLTDIDFYVEGEKETYSEGDVIRVWASYDEELCLTKHFVIDADKENCYKDYTVEAMSHYVKTADELSAAIIQEAVDKANSAFTTKSAKEFGVRVYFEAGIPPVYSNGGNRESTFEWVSYRPISAYLKVPKDEIAGKNSHNYNDLDIVYSGVMTQADGKNVNVEAVVRFKDIIINNDGTYDADFSKPTMSSCSHFDSRIKETVIKNYEEDYTVEKLTLP